MLSAPLPGAAGAAGLKAHLFANCGGLVDVDVSRTLKSDPKLLGLGLLDETRAAVGCGLCFAPANFARIELNYGSVLKAKPCDLIKRLSFSITASFGS